MKRKRHLDSSLDLLLDTICDTFGGIVFVTMLIVVLLQMSSPVDPAADPLGPASEDLRDLESRRTALDVELAALRQAVESQADLSADVVSEDAEKLHQELSQLESQLQQAQIEQIKLVGKLAEAQKGINELAGKQSALEQQLSAAELALQEALAKYKSAANKLVRSAKMPRQRETDKATKPIFLRGGRLTGFATPDNSLSEDEFDVIIEPRQVRPKAGVGEKLDPNAPWNGEVHLRQYSPNQLAFVIVVYPDSFGEFQPLKTALVEAGFEYNLMPWPNDGFVGVSDEPRKPEERTVVQ